VAALDVVGIDLELGLAVDLGVIGQQHVAVLLKSIGPLRVLVDEDLAGERCPGSVERHTFVELVRMAVRLLVMHADDVVDMLGPDRHVDTVQLRLDEAAVEQRLVGHDPVGLEAARGGDHDLGSRVVDAGGVSGTVASMNIASTTIKTFDNKTMVVPNNRIWSDVITNATGVSERRVDMEFGIGYDDDIDRAQAILEEIIGGHPLVLKEPEPTIKLSALGESSVNFIARPWAKTGDYWQVFWDVTKAVKQRFDAEGIGIPFPQRDVHLYLEGPAGAAVAGKLAGEAKDEAPVQRRDGGLDV